jgi:hypothetical protein
MKITREEAFCVLEIEVSRLRERGTAVALAGWAQFVVQCLMRLASLVDRRLRRIRES